MKIKRPRGPNRYPGADELVAAIATQARLDSEGYDENPWCSLEAGHYIHSTDPEEIDRYGECDGVERCVDHEQRLAAEGPHAKAHRVATCAAHFLGEMQDRLRPAAPGLATQGEMQHQDDPMGLILEIVGR